MDTAYIGGLIMSCLFFPEGMCMSVQSFEPQAHMPAAGMLAGFDDGSIGLWNMRYTGKHLTSMKMLFDTVQKNLLDFLL